jgi:hypothetical protein
LELINGHFSAKSTELTMTKIGAYVRNLKGILQETDVHCANFTEFASKYLNINSFSDCFSFNDWNEFLLNEERSEVCLIQSFGQPGVRIPLNSWSQLEVIHWINSQTTIHDHGFNGAFSLLSGAVIQIDYSFRKSHCLCDGLDLGTVARKSFEVVEAGQVMPIEAGRKFIHETYHIGLPTIVVVLRTRGNQSDIHQYDYFPPHLACHADILGNCSPTLTEYARFLLYAEKFADLRKLCKSLLREKPFNSCIPFLLANPYLIAYTEIDDLKKLCITRHTANCDAILNSLLATLAKFNSIKDFNSVRDPRRKLLHCANFAQVRFSPKHEKIKIGGIPAASEHDLINLLERFRSMSLMPENS